MNRCCSIASHHPSSSDLLTPEHGEQIFLTLHVGHSQTAACCDCAQVDPTSQPSKCALSAQVVELPLQVNVHLRDALSCRINDAFQETNEEQQLHGGMPCGMRICGTVQCLKNAIWLMALLSDRTLDAPLPDQDAHTLMTLPYMPASTTLQPPSL